MKPAAKSYSAKPEDFPLSAREWFLVDAEGKTLGRIACKIADVLRGKNKPTFTPHVDTGAFVIVINAEKVSLSGKKLDQKIYYRHTGYIGHLKSVSARDLLATKPEEIILKAVKGMLPHNKLADQMIKKLKIFAGNEHPHAAQNPAPLEL
ncbi:MAG: 50S ribosomal protein L13 [Nitrospinota bacterium]|nr:50S ribosomal protein L13 [Nitrospinota bacterium]MDH5677076.1 50S ribosomal protein L13 [Nitrospinota bacterium]MDH5755282.1 50S ribosomal protein L13 [Nitrospinota bacterium]